MQCKVELHRARVIDGKTQKPVAQWWATLKLSEDRESSVCFSGHGTSPSAAMDQARESFVAFSKEVLSILDEAIGEEKSDG